VPSHCPKCGLKTDREALWFRFACEGCGTVLRPCKARALVAYGAIVAGVGMAITGKAQRADGLATAGGALAVGGFVAMLFPPRLRAAGERGRCPWCMYDLSGLPPGAACPECGRSETAMETNR
jgi:hypothetical protein